MLTGVDIALRGIRKLKKLFLLVIFFPKHLISGGSCYLFVHLYKSGNYVLLEAVSDMPGSCLKTHSK